MRRILQELRPTLALAVPITIGQLSQMLMGVTDSLMIGQTGTVPLAASAFGGNVFGVFYVVGIGLMTPVAVFVAHARGAAKPREAAEYLRHGVALALVCGLIETIVLLLLGTQLHRFGQPPEVLAIVRPFFLLIGCSITPVLLFLVLREYAEAMGRPWIPMIIMLGAVALNAFLNWIFIYGHWGAPAMGLTGAGLTTLIARSVGLAVLFAWLRRDARFRAAWPTQWFAPLAWSRVREMLRLGLPASGMLLFESGAFASSAVMMGWLGAIPLAAHQIALSCASMTFMFFLGLAMASGMQLSAALGAGEIHRFRPIGHGALLLNALIALVFVSCYLVAGRWIADWFVDDAAVIALGAQLLVVVAIFQLFDGTQVIAAALLRALRDVRVPVVITFIAYWLVAVLGGFVFGVHGRAGALGIWSALAAGLGLAAIFLTLRFQALTARLSHRPA